MQKSSKQEQQRKFLEDQQLQVTGALQMCFLTTPGVVCLSPGRIRTWGGTPGLSVRTRVEGPWKKEYISLCHPLPPSQDIKTWLTRTMEPLERKKYIEESYLQGMKERGSSIPPMPPLHLRLVSAAIGRDRKTCSIPGAALHLYGTDGDGKHVTAQACDRLGSSEEMTCIDFLAATYSLKA